MPIARGDGMVQLKRSVEAVKVPTTGFVEEKPEKVTPAGRVSVTTNPVALFPITVTAIE